MRARRADRCRWQASLSREPPTRTRGSNRRRARVRPRPVRYAIDADARLDPLSRVSCRSRATHRWRLAGVRVSTMTAWRRRSHTVLPPTETYARGARGRPGTDRRGCARCGAKGHTACDDHTASGIGLSDRRNEKGRPERAALRCPAIRERYGVILLTKTSLLPNCGGPAAGGARLATPGPGPARPGRNASTPGPPPPPPGSL